MSNKTKGPGKKGSRLWIQEILNPKVKIELQLTADEKGELKERLEGLIGLGKIEWLSPIEYSDVATPDGFQEYQLGRPNADEHVSGDQKIHIHDELALPRSNDLGFWNFWPQGGVSQTWDAIGRVKPGNKIVLIEAKAHTGEGDTRSGPRKGKGLPGREKNNELITKSFTDTLAELNKIPDNEKEAAFNEKEEAWFYTYYQTANRLTFWHKLNEKNCNVILVFLNFVGDKTNKTTGKDDWEKYVERKFDTLLGKAQIKWDENPEVGTLNGIPTIKIINFPVPPIC